MKEATGELNMTVITIIAIAAVAGLFYAFVWPAIKSNMESTANCSSAYNCEQTCDSQTNKRTCNYTKIDDSGNETVGTVECPCQ